MFVVCNDCVYKSSKYWTDVFILIKFSKTVPTLLMFNRIQSTSLEIIRNSQLVILYVSISTSLKDQPNRNGNVNLSSDAAMKSTGCLSIIILRC